MKNLKFKYEVSTQTIRTIPENYCLCRLETFMNGGDTDSAILNIIAGNGDPSNGPKYWANLDEAARKQAIDKLGNEMVARLNNGVPAYLDDEQADRAGTIIARDFELKKDTEHPDRYRTASDTFTARGIARRAHRFIKESAE